MNTQTSITRATPPVPVDRDAVSAKFDRLGEPDVAFLVRMMGDPMQDEALIDGLHRHLDLAAAGRFINALKLEKAGFWLGNTAPARLQMRLMEAARSSQHAAYQAFRSGLVKSGGLDRAFPKV